MYIRRLQSQIFHDLSVHAAVALLGPRQVGKTTLARAIGATGHQSISISKIPPIAKSWLTRLWFCALNNANSDKVRTRRSNGLVAFSELGFEMLGHRMSGLML
jgi:ATPase subunit of ABC transporter with duplicated ATPase domains